MTKVTVTAINNEHKTLTVAVAPEPVTLRFNSQSRIVSDGKELEVTDFFTHVEPGTELTVEREHDFVKTCTVDSVPKPQPVEQSTKEDKPHAPERKREENTRQHAKAVRKR